MDFNDTREEAEFRQEARQWLGRHAEPKSGAFETWQSRYPGREGYDGLERARAFQARKAEAGFAALHWPAEWGGRALPPIYQVIYAQEETKFLVPRGYFEIGLGMCMPTLFAYGTESQKRRYAPSALRGDEVWCQLFSEPGAGSDLAGLRTRAQRDGDDWVINGQKIWTSGAHWADWAILVARSDPKAAKHKGLTFFFLSMKSPGIETRRIKQISGASHFNEVYFTDVRIPDGQRLGAVGAGWGVAITTLMNERLTSGDLRGPDFEEIFGLARSTVLEDGPAITNAAVRERLADLYVKTQGVRLTRFRTMTALSRGETPGPENSIGKLVAGSMIQDVAMYALDLQGAAGVVSSVEDAELAGRFQAMLLRAPGTRVEGGTDEIMRNIIAERVLGLPGDIRVDKDVPFNKIPTRGRG